MTGRKISDALGYVDARYIEEAAELKISKSRKIITKYGAIAACLCIIAALAVPFAADRLSFYYGDRARIIYGDEGIPDVQSKDLLRYLTEDELFEDERLYAFRGRVEKLENLTLDFGISKVYRCVATIKIEKVIKGDIEEGSKIKMLIPCPIGVDIWVEDTRFISLIREDMEGIFMPRAYDEDSRMEMDGKSVYFKEIASCGLGDGERWAFLDIDGRIVFSASYVGAAGAGSLDEIEEYVIKMLEKNNVKCKLKAYP